MPATTTPDETSYHSSSDLVATEESAQSLLRTPLLDGVGGDGDDSAASASRGVVRQRGAAASNNVSFSSYRDVEQALALIPPTPTPHTPSRGGRTRRRILDRSGNFRQSRGRWGVDRQHTSSQRTTEGGRASRWRQWLQFFCCCCRSMHREWGKDWFFWLAYQKTYFLFILLFLSYGLIIVFFGFIYLVSGGGESVDRDQ